MEIPLGNPEKPIRADCNILYSGGLDSTAVGLMMAQKFTGRVHLSTMRHNYGLLFVRWSEKHVADLQRLYGADRIVHAGADLSPVFRQITLATLRRDFWDYGHFVWCLGCTMSMVVEALIYNLEHRVPFLFICSSVGGEYSAMSMPASLAGINALTREYGVNYRAPLLELAVRKDEERLMLKDRGVWPGWKFRRGSHGVQPICIPGFQHSLDVLFDLHTTYPPDKVAAYIESRREPIRRIVRAALEAKGIDPDAAIAALHELHRELEADAVR